MPIDANAIHIRQKQILLNALMAIKKEPFEPHTGICPNIDYATMNIPGTIDMFIQTVFKDIAQSWPKYSGDQHYPVPATFSDETPRTAYAFAYTHEGMWGGEYGTLRKELLDYAISELEKELHA